MIALRNTIQQQIILQAAQRMQNHPTVEDVYQEIHEEYPTISKATVYRNLRQLAEEGKIKQVLLPESPERFDNHLSKHYHFQCKKCNSIFDVDIGYLTEINDKVNSIYGFQIDEHDIIFKGICPKCQHSREA